MIACTRCGEQNADGARFCSNCANPLGATQPSSEVRKTVTVMFMDAVGSTGLGERTDPESLRRVMTRYFGEIRTIVERHGGTVEKYIGERAGPRSGGAGSPRTGRGQCEASGGDR